jgi:putative glutamine amidotransferase
MVRPRILIPGRTLPPGRASRHPVVFAGVRYLRALRRAGAIEMVVGPRPLEPGDAGELLGLADGLLLIGGQDVDPALYGEDPHPRTYGVNREEDDFEVALVRAAVEIDVPTLAVCRGCQVANVALGGDLEQHITDRPGILARGLPTFPKSEPNAIGPLVPVSIAPGSRLAEATGGSRALGSHSHHQSVRRLGDGLVVTGVGPDGVIEAIEHEQGWFVAVQWHPEDTAEDDPVQQRLFDRFVEQAGANRASASLLAP